MDELKVLAFCGSLRKDSFNKKLLLIACEELRRLQNQVTYIDLKAFDLPIYDGDLEEEFGLPDGAKRLISEINSADSLVIASPEYNGGVTAALKNAIDWATRGDANPFLGKPIMVLGTSPGHWGAIKSSLNLRTILTHLRAVVIPTQVQIPNAEKAITKEGTLAEESHMKLLKMACDDLLRTTRALKHEH